MPSKKKNNKHRNAAEASAQHARMNSASAASIETDATIHSESSKNDLDNPTENSVKMEVPNAKVLENVTNCPSASSESTDNCATVQLQTLLLQKDSVVDQSIADKVKSQSEASTVPKNPMDNQPVTPKANSAPANSQPQASTVPKNPMDNQPVTPKANSAPAKSQPQASTVPKNPMDNQPVTPKANSASVESQPQASARPNTQVKNQAETSAAMSRQGRNTCKLQPPMNTASANTSDNQKIGPERSSSAFPSIREAIGRISSPSASTTERARSNSVQSGRRRRITYSVIPDSPSLLPIRRPDNGGTLGMPIEVYTNHFAIQMDDAIINHYDVNIYLVTREQRLVETRKDSRWEVLQKITKMNPQFPIVWYDEGKNLYTKELLTDYDKPIQVTLDIDGEERTFQLHIKNLVRQEKISTIFDFIHKKTLIRPRDTMRVIETLFKQSARNEQICIRNQYYDRKQKPDDLGDGRGMAFGFYEALFLTRSGPTLNMNLTFTCFYDPINFLEFACKYLRKDIKRHGLNEIELKTFRKIVYDMQIETRHTGHELRYRIRGFGLSANQIKFKLNYSKDPQELSLDKEISVADYFETKYKKLKYPDLPCIDARNGRMDRSNWLPMEICQIVPWQRSIKPLDTQQRALVSKKTIVKPEERYVKIMNLIERRAFQNDRYLKALNVKVDTKEMLKVPARVLPPPEIKYRARDGAEIPERVNFGNWTIRNRFFMTREIQTWGIIYFSTRPPKQDTLGILKSFQDQLPPLLQVCGINFKTKPSCLSKPCDDNTIEDTLLNASKNKWQIAVVILHDTPDHVYDVVKRCGNQKFGLVTQCIDFVALSRNISKLKMYVQNLSQKINAKLGGINGVVNIKSALSRPSNEDLFMFFGADVTHTTCQTDRPSIAAVVGSRDPTNTLYAARLSEQYPDHGRCSLEIILQLNEIVVDLLRLFANSCGNRLPTRIIFYRDGVDDGQYQKVLENELTRIKSAFRVVYGNRPLPKLTYLVVKKRHNTRFFDYDGNETKNIGPGTVIDQYITHPSQFDFYLCSQKAIMGTSRPALYHVLHDENGFTSDEIQRLTFWLCHTDARCSKSVSIPTPVHYAHLAAYGARHLDFDDEVERNADEPLDDDDPVTLEDIRTKLLILDAKMADQMWFV